MKTRNLYILVAGCLLSACSHQPQATVEQAVKVHTITVGEQSVAESRAYSGTVEESAGAALSFSVPGTILSLNVDEGDRVGAGQVIGRVDASNLQNTYEISHAALVQAQDAYNRLKMLHDANALAEVRWVEAQQVLKQAQSAEAIARKGVGDARLTAPRAGYVSEKYADVGQTVAPGQPVVKVVDIDPIKVSISLPENQVQHVAIGQNAIITVDALDGVTFVGQVKEKGVSANPISRSYDVKIELPNPQGQLLPGMICQVNLENADTTARAIVVPNDAVLLDADNQNFVWLARRGRAQKQVVSVSGMADNGLVVASGLAVGDTVIVTGQQKVSTGTPLACE